MYSRGRIFFYLCIAFALASDIFASAAASDDTTEDDTTDAVAITDVSSFVRLVRDSDGIYLADIVHVGPPPGFWSGYVEAYQTVRYRFVESLVKHASWDVPSEQDIEFLIIQTSPWAQAKEPALRADLFSKGVRHLVLFLPVSRQQEACFARVSDRASVVVFKCTTSPE